MLIQSISTGIPVLAVPIHSLSALGRSCVNQDVLSEAETGAGAISCYTFTRETLDDGESEAHARLFAHDSGIPYDPVTGSAPVSLAVYLVAHGATSAPAEDERFFCFCIEQGDFMLRPSRISAEVKGARRQIEQVGAGGPSVIGARGESIFTGVWSQKPEVCSQFDYP